VLQPKITKALRSSEPDKIPVVHKGRPFFILVSASAPPPHSSHSLLPCCCCTHFNGGIMVTVMGVAFTGERFQMSYFFQPTRAAHSVVLPVEKAPAPVVDDEETQLPSEREEQGVTPAALSGAGGYRAFKPLGMSIIVTVAPPDSLIVSRQARGQMATTSPHTVDAVATDGTGDGRGAVPSDTVEDKEAQELEDFFTQLDSAYADPPSTSTRPKVTGKEAGGQKVPEEKGPEKAKARKNEDEERLLPLRKSPKRDAKNSGDKISTEEEKTKPGRSKKPLESLGESDKDTLFESLDTKSDEESQDDHHAWLQSQGSDESSQAVSAYEPFAPL